MLMKSLMHDDDQDDDGLGSHCQVALEDAEVGEGSTTKTNLESTAFGVDAVAVADIIDDSEIVTLLGETCPSHDTGPVDDQEPLDRHIFLAASTGVVVATYLMLHD